MTGPLNPTTERDPDGLEAHDPGSKLDAGKPDAWLMVAGFSRALTAVADVATFGARKYSPDGWRNVANGAHRYTAALLRHLLAEPHEDRDPDSELLHVTHVAWNALAMHQRPCHLTSTSIMTDSFDGSPKKHRPLPDRIQMGRAETPSHTMSAHK